MSSNALRLTAALLPACAACVDSNANRVAVVQGPFSADERAGHAPLTVVFEPFDSPLAVGRSWDFDGDGDEDSTAARTSFTYETPGKYDVTLTTVFAGGERTVDHRRNYIEVLAPVADFEYEGALEPLGLVRFRDVSMPAPLERHWTFEGIVGERPGDVAEAVVQFTAAGEFEVSLTVTRAGGTTQTAAKTVKVLDTAADDVLADFDFALLGDEPPLDVEFENRTTWSGDATPVYEWDFGDGGSSTAASPLHTFREAGEFEVRLRASLGVVGHEAARTVTVHPRFTLSPSAIGSTKIGKKHSVAGTIEGNPTASFDWAFEAVGGGDAVGGHLLDLGSSADVYVTINSGVFDVVATDVHGRRRSARLDVIDFGFGFQWPTPTTGANGHAVAGDVAAGGDRYYLAYRNVEQSQNFVRQYSLLDDGLLCTVGEYFAALPDCPGAASLPAPFSDTRPPNVAADQAGNGYWFDEDGALYRMDAETSAVTAVELVDPHEPFSGHIAAGPTNQLVFTAEAADGHGIVHVDLQAARPISTPVASVGATLSSLAVDAAGRIVVALRTPDGSALERYRPAPGGVYEIDPEFPVPEPFAGSPDIDVASFDGLEVVDLDSGETDEPGEGRLYVLTRPAEPAGDPPGAAVRVLGNLGQLHDVADSWTELTLGDAVYADGAICLDPPDDCATDDLTTFQRALGLGVGNGGRVRLLDDVEVPSNNHSARVYGLDPLPNR